MASKLWKLRRSVFRYRWDALKSSDREIASGRTAEGRPTAIFGLSQLRLAVAVGCRCVIRRVRRSGQETGKYIASKLWKLRRSLRSLSLNDVKVRSGDLNIYSIEVKKNFDDRVFSQTNLF